MTKQSELDEILQNHFRGYAARSFPEYQDNASEVWNNSVEKAKQAILDWHNKQIEEVLDRLVRQGTAGVGLMGDTYIPLSAIEAERSKLNPSKSIPFDEPKEDK